MLYKCPECSILYLISNHAHVCNQCGEYLQRRIERLHEVDDAIEWWRICSWAMLRHGKQAEIEWPEG